MTSYRYNGYGYAQSRSRLSGGKKKQSPRHVQHTVYDTQIHDAPPPGGGDAGEYNIISYYNIIIPVSLARAYGRCVSARQRTRRRRCLLVRVTGARTGNPPERVRAASREAATDVASYRVTGLRGGPGTGTSACARRGDVDGDGADPARW